MFENARKKYKDGQYKLVVAKTIDKYEFCKTKNKITYTDFLNISEIAILEKILKEEKIKNYIFYGGKSESDRKVLLFYPEKYSLEMVEKNFSNIFKVIRITLPKDMEYEHRQYLSGIMKCGIKREKFGDITVKNNSADIIVFSDVSKILLEDLKNLTRFRKSKIEIVDIKSIIDKMPEFEEEKIIVSSIRLDNFVSELAKCSRTKASIIIKEGRVFVNSINDELKDSKKININDIITIRGKGKFIFEGIENKTKSGKYLLNIKKYK